MQVFPFTKFVNDDFQQKVRSLLKQIFQIKSKVKRFVNDNFIPPTLLCSSVVAPQGVSLYCDFAPDL